MQSQLPTPASDARLNRSGRGPVALDVVGEHRRIEAVGGVVGQVDCMLLIASRNHAEHGSEDLFASNG